uniref:methionyl-tRNA formyltransferase n=1 Tax=Clastoptera arizonana TaxID=38151 RepID=A0A1B6CTX3_9HEMI
MVHLRTLWYFTFCYPYSNIFELCKAYSLKNNVFIKAGNNYSTKTDGPPWRILYFGNDNFSLTCIKPLCSKLRTGTLISNLSVVSNSGTVVRNFAETEKLPLYDWPLDPNSIKTKFDLGIVVAFGHLISENIINALPLGIINVHGSLLPRWRGAAPIVHAVKNGDIETGVTVMRIKPKRFDTGDIVRQYRCSIGPDETAKKLTERLAKHGAQLIMESIRDLPRCLDLATPQPSEGVTLAPRLNVSISTVDFKEMSAQEVYNLHRAISHVYPVMSHWHGAPIRLFGILPDKEQTLNIAQSGTLPTSNKSAIDFLNADTVKKLSSQCVMNGNTVPGLMKWNPRTKIIKIQCSDGKYVICSSFALAGKKHMTSVDFYNGYLSKRKENEWILK